MKENTKLIGYIVIFVIIIVIAVWGYNYLSNNYSNEYVEEQGKVLEKATDFIVVDDKGESVSLSSFFGKPVIVNFWATWCGPCRTELPEFESAYNKYDDEINFLMVNLTDGFNDTIDGVNEFIKENNYTFPIYYDTKENAAKAYKIYSIPQTLFIDKDGNVKKSYIGSIDEKTLKKYIEEIL